MPRHEVFRKGLAGLQACGGGRWSKKRQPCRCEAIGNSQAERQLRADDRQVDSLASGQRQQAVDVGSADRFRAHKLPNTRISRGANEIRGAFVAGKPCNERVLARPAADDENSHSLKDLRCVQTL